MGFLKKQWNKLDCFIIFSIAFIPVAVFMDALFTKAGVNFIRQTDGISQHFNMFIYLERYLRSIVTGIIKGGGINAPLMNYTIGQGTDIILTLNGYDFFNPVCILSVILFRKDLFFAYEFMIFANLYLAGIAFCVFCRSIGRTNGWYNAAGALIYSFCGYALHFGTWAPIFISGMILMPLLFASTEAFYKKQRALWLIITVFFSLTINYFTFYMNVIFLGVYLLIRHFPCPKDEIKDRIIAILKMAGATIIGGLLSAGMLLPAFFGALFNNGAYQVAVGYTDSKLFYPADYYLKMIKYFWTTAHDAGFLNYLGFAPIAMFGLWVLFMSGKKELNRARVAVCIGFAALSIPFIGRALNGFRYANNRWAYAFGFVVAFALVETLDEMSGLTFRKNMLIIAGVMGLIFLWFNDGSFDASDKISMMLLILSVAVVLLCSRPYMKKLAPVVYIVLIVLSDLANITIQFQREYAGQVYDFCDAGEGYGIYTKYSSSRVAGTADDEDFYRIEMQEERVNTEGYNNVRGTTIYFSAVDGNCQRYYDDLQLTSRSHLTQMYGVSGCRALLDLASVKYFTLPSEDMEAYVPYGFSKAGDCVYENEYHLAPAFLYDKYIAYEDFMSLSAPDRQQAMLQGAILEDGTDIVGRISPSPRAREVEYTVSKDNVYWENGYISTSDKGGSVTFTFEPQPGCELYLWIDGMTLDKEIAAKRGVSVEAGYYEDGEYEPMISKSVTMSSPRYAYYVNRLGDNFNLGYSEDGYNYCTLSLEGVCSYQNNGIHIMAVPMDTYMEDIEALRDTACDDITIGRDSIYGTVTCKNDSLLQLSIPYSIGWKAYVDGKKVPIRKSDLMYMALELSAGSHEIKMKYCTPYLKAGLAISFITLAGLIAFAVMRKKKRA